MFFSNTNFTEKNVDVSGIRTRIVTLEGEHVDHLTTTNHCYLSISNRIQIRKSAENKLMFEQHATR